MRLGISSFTYVWSVGVPGFFAPSQPLAPGGLLEKAVQLGVRVVQIADNLPLDRLTIAELDSLASAAQAHDLCLELGTSGIDPDHLHTYLTLAMRLRSTIVRTIIDTKSSQPTPDEVVAKLRRVLPQFERAGVWLAIENHDCFPAATLATIIERCASQHVGVCLDTANSLGCGEDLRTVLDSLGGWVVNLHIKDFCVRRLPHKKGFIVEGCPAGQGLLNIPRLLADLRNLRRDPNVILELWPPPEDDIGQSVAKEEAWTRDSIRYLRQFVPE